MCRAKIALNTITCDGMLGQLSLYSYHCPAVTVFCFYVEARYLGGIYCFRSTPLSFASINAGRLIDISSHDASIQICIAWSLETTISVSDQMV